VVGLVEGFEVTLVVGAADGCAALVLGAPPAVVVTVLTVDIAVDVDTSEVELLTLVLSNLLSAVDALVETDNCAADVVM